LRFEEIDSLVRLIVSTYFPSKNEIVHRWYLVDAKDQALGRLATHVANLLTGKLKPTWVPFMDSGDHVIVINADRVKLTGKKLDQKVYHRHTGFPGGLKSTVAKDLKSKHADRMVELAVKGMLPKNKLGRAVGKKLRVYTGPEHPHSSQGPEVSAVVR
jgi:large subunit ribosomal protein L13